VSLLADRYRLIRYDDRGFGRSPAPAASFTRLADARALQWQWDQVINARAALQTVAGLVSGPRAGPQALKSVTGIRDSPDARPGRAVIVGTRFAPSVPDRGRGNLWLSGENR
jgi:hypothetical protein